MKGIILCLVMMFCFDLISQERLFEIDFYPSVYTDTIPFSDSLHTKTFYNMDTYVRLVYVFINIERKYNGLNPLVMDCTLMCIAQKHSDKMAIFGDYKHSGLNYNEVINHISSILESSHKQSAGCAVKQWMDSDTPRDALLDPDFKTFGIGVQENKSGVTIFGGKRYEVINNTYFTVIFDY